MSPSAPPSQTGETVRSNESHTGRTRRSILRTTAAGLAGSSLLGRASAAPVESLDHLSTDGNLIVDESDSPVQINGCTLIDPSRSYRGWRGKTIDEQFELAVSDDWPHNMIRLPCRPQDIASSRTPSDTQNESLLPHGDAWGPIKPGTFSEDDLIQYLEDFVDPLVETAKQSRVYLMIDYHTERPVFHQAQFATKAHRGLDFWQQDRYDCGPSTEYDWDWDEGMCGHRGRLWHGPNQIEDIESIPHNKNKLDDPETADPWFDPWCGADGGEDLVGQELDLFWETVADRYGGDSTDHVVFDIYNEPTGPYFGDWGDPGRMPAGEDGYRSGGEDVADEENGRPYWALFLERSKWWLNTAAENAPERFMTIGSPRWSQWTFWASELTFNGVCYTNSLPGVDDGANNIGYSAHAHVQEALRPLAKYFGEPSNAAPVLFTEFGWETGGGPDWSTYLGGLTEVWGDGDMDAIEQWGRPEGTPDPNDLDESEQGEMNHFGLCPEDTSQCPLDDDPDHTHYPPMDAYVGFRKFFGNFPVHPFGSRFDHTRTPRFFSDEDTDDWELNPREDTPGAWWQEYVNDHGEDAPPGGDNTWTDISGAFDYCGHVPPPPTTTTTSDGDGLVYDVNDNGKIDFPDVNELFQMSDTTDDEKYDYTDDGEVDLQDVLALFDKV